MHSFLCKSAFNTSIEINHSKSPTGAYLWNSQAVDTNCPVTVNFSSTTGKLRKMARDNQKDKSVI